MKNNEKLISIIIPVYNVENYLEQCIHSILNQSHRNLDIILVDDGSTDQSGVLCDTVASKDARIRVIHKSNGGLSSARNAGLDIARGDFIGFIDSDDYADSDMYEQLLNTCLNENAEIAMCGRHCIYEETGEKIDIFRLDRAVIMDSHEAIRRLLLWDGCDSAAWDKLYVRSIFDGVRYPVGVLHEDLNITTRLFDRANRLAHIGEAKYNYLVRKSSICNQPFSEKKMDLFYQAHMNTVFLRQRYPDLIRETGHFICRNIMVLMSAAANCSGKKNRKLMHQVIHLGYNYSGEVIKNPIIGFSMKIDYAKILFELAIRTMFK